MSSRQGERVNGVYVQCMLWGLITCVHEISREIKCVLQPFCRH